jgi:uncharacterized protein DUF4398
MIARAAVLLAALAAGACAFVPQRNARLDDAVREYESAAAEPAVARFAQHELALARDTLDRATAARDTLQDVAEVDHLAYLTHQRIAISREAALQRSMGAR